MRHHWLSSCCCSFHLQIQQAEGCIFFYQFSISIKKATISIIEQIQIQIQEAEGCSKKIRAKLITIKKNKLKRFAWFGIKVALNKNRASSVDRQIQIQKIGL